MAISGKLFSTDKLSDMLFHITQFPGVTLPAQNAIRAVAFLLEDAAAIESADKIAKLVLTAISPQVAQIHVASENISTMATQMNTMQTKISESITNTNSNNIDAIIDSVDIGSRIEKVQEAVTTLTSHVKEASQQGGYKAVLLTGIDNDANANPQATQRAARNAIKARQILIDIPSDSPLAPGKVSHAQLVEKIKEALKMITKDDTPDLEIRAISQFRNGGTVIEMLTPQAAAHLRTKTVKEEFINVLDLKATLKERSYLVIIQFVPLTFNPSDAEQIQDLEQENGWEQESITSARWVKPPAKRTTTQ
ncbi:hypothetical protein DFH29DRAFT_1007309 [Suillus ampliporus]|nr:hypothetical protein DFH29DRAFT_1007309 [Suillus ampliporus]